jgi:hypothetical protein
MDAMAATPCRADRRKQGAFMPNGMIPGDFAIERPWNWTLQHPRCLATGCCVRGQLRPGQGLPPRGPQGLTDYEAPYCYREIFGRHRGPDSIGRPAEIDGILAGRAILRSECFLGGQTNDNRLSPVTIRSHEIVAKFEKNMGDHQDSALHLASLSR